MKPCARRVSTFSTMIATTGPGAKFAAMDLIGLPWQLIVGPKGLKAGEVELKERSSGARHSLTFDSALNRLVAAAEESKREDG